MKIDRKASLNSFFQVSQSFRPLEQFGVNLHHSCKDGLSKSYWCAIQRPDGQYQHLDIRTIPGGRATSRTTDSRNIAVAQVHTGKRLAFFEKLLNTAFRNTSDLLRHLESAHPV